MGFGAAFATGLVQGFTQNIQEEKARRLADQQKIDALNQLLVQSATKKDASQSGIQAVAKLVKSAQKDLDSREPIDIFGRQTDGLDIDFTTLAGIVNKKELEYNTTIAGGGETLGFMSNFGKNPNENTGIQLLNEVANMGDASVEKLKQNPALRNALEGQINAARGVIDNSIAGETLKSGQGVDKILPYDYDLLNPFYEKLEETAPKQTEATANGVADAITKNTGEPVDSVVVFNDGVQTITFETAEQKNALNLVAKGLNTTPANAANAFIDSLKDVPFLTQQQKANLFVASVKIGAIPGIAGMDPDENLKKMTSQKLDQALQVMLDAVGDPNLSSENTFNNLVIALTPYMTPPQRKEVIVAGRKAQSLGSSRNDYVLNAAENIYKTFGELAQAAEKNDTTYGQLLSFRDTLVKNPDSVFAYSSFKATTRAVIDIGKGFADDAVGFFFRGEEKEGETYFTDTDQLNNFVNQRVEQQRRLGEKVGQGSLFAELEAMRISLAFQLARAADPSGRLSNQDIEVQLIRLGSNFRTKEDAVAALNVVIRDVKRERDRLNALVQLGGQGDITDAEAREIDASIAVTKLITNRNDMIARGRAITQEVATTLTPPAEGTPPSSQVTAADGSPVYMVVDDNGYPITDSTGFGMYTDAQGNRVTDLKPIAATPLQKAPDAAPAPTPAATVTARPVQQSTTVQVPKQPEQPQEQPEQPEEAAAPAGSVSINDVRGGDVTPKPLGTSPPTFELMRGANRLPGIYTWDPATQSFIPMK
jgi:hypothetical protein